MKSLTDTLRPYLSGARVLDLYAGQGRFGLAALEEEASVVVMVERQRRLVDELRKVAQRWPDRLKIVLMDVARYLPEAAQRGETFDILFADPPFPDWNPAFAQGLFTALVPPLAPEGILVVKYPSRAPLPEPHGLALFREVEFGESRLLYYRHA